MEDGMNFKVKNDTGTEIEIDADTVTSVEDVGCEEHCVVHIGVVPIRVEGDAKKMGKAIGKLRGIPCLVTLFKAAAPESETGLPTESGENIPPPAAEEGAGEETGPGTEGAA